MAKYQEILDAINELRESFGRIDERSANIWKLTEQQEKHLAKLNDNIMKHAVQISSNKTSVKWIVRLLIAAVIIGSGATGLIQWLG